MTGIPDELVEKAARVADEHWITNHNGPRCVGCGWWEPNNGEDISRAARRHVAEVAVTIGLPALLERVEAAEAEAERWKNNEHLWRDMRDERDALKVDNERLRGICEARKRENAMVCDRRDALAAKVADKGEADRLLNYALHLRMNGERAPGGNETWAQFDRDCESYLRAALTEGKKP